VDQLGPCALCVEGPCLRQLLVVVVVVVLLLLLLAWVPLPLAVCSLLTHLPALPVVALPACPAGTPLRC